MRMIDIIQDKRSGKALSDEQIGYFVEEYTNGTIPDYQASALLMAICFQGMDARETATLTDRMAHSGEMADLSGIPGIKVDKHSTGGVGDKTTLIVGPIVAACGVKVAKMSGRGLGHTGGTLDKLEAIPGLSVTVDRERFFEIVRENGISVIGQSGNLAPADKKLYALRDVTGTIDEPSLIAASIMSKKIAAGADAIVLDVKTGSGAFMKTLEDSIRLAEIMVDIGTRVGRKTTALITDMDRPLGYAVGNALEVREAVETLHGKGPEDLTALCLSLAEAMLALGGKGTPEACRKLAEAALRDGTAFQKFRNMAVLQGGNPSVLDDPDKFPQAAYSREVLSPKGGFVRRMVTEQIGTTSAVLGAGREKKEDSIDYSAGILLRRKTGDRVEAGEPLAVLYTSRKEAFPAAEEMFLNAVEISGEAPAPEKLIYAVVTEKGVERY